MGSKSKENVPPGDVTDKAKTVSSKSPAKGEATESKKSSPSTLKPTTNKKSSTSENMLLFAVFVAVVAVMLAAMPYLRKGIDFKQVISDLQDGKDMLFNAPKKLNPMKQDRNRRIVGPEPGVTIADPTTIPPEPVSFTVLYNGDGTGLYSPPISILSSDFTSLNDVVQQTCVQLLDNLVTKPEREIVDKSQCDPAVGARIFTETGVRIYSFNDIKQNSRTYIVPQGILFVYPLLEVGNEIIPESVEEVIPGKPIKLIQLSESPRVFSVENFMSVEEMEKVIDHNKDLVKPSEVGFSGWRDPTRTSYTAWDHTSWAAKKIQRRSFDLLGMSYAKDMADAVQVLRYGNTEWYKPHCDWFDAKGYEGHDPTINNGTNRFATVFLYLSDVEAGGETVFPLSTTHEGYNGEYLVHKGTSNTAGYISNSDAKWVCNTSSTALRVAPKPGSAVLFYSQGPSGELDKLSLHGGCPVVEGTKWSANVWIWNRPKPSKSQAKPEDKKRAEAAKDGKTESTDGSIQVTMRNEFGEPIEVFWDDGSEEMVFQFEIAPGAGSPLTTYEGHGFVAKRSDGTKLGKFRAKKDDHWNDVFFT